MTVYKFIVIAMALALVIGCASVLPKPIEPSITITVPLNQDKLVHKPHFYNPFNKRVSMSEQDKYFKELNDKLNDHDSFNHLSTIPDDGQNPWEGNFTIPNMN